VRWLRNADFLSFGGAMSRLLLAVGVILGSAGMVAALGVATAAPAGASAAGTTVPKPPAQPAQPKVPLPHLTVPKGLTSGQLRPGASHAGAVVPDVTSTPEVPEVAGGATFAVDTTTDLKAATPTANTCKATTATGKCSLRAAVDAADHAPAGVADTITVPSGTYLLSTAAGFGTLDVTHQVLITGPAGGPAPVVSARKKFELLRISTTGTGPVPAVEISGMTLENGFAEGGGGVIYDAGALTLTGVTVTGGSAAGGGGIFVTHGALWADATTSVTGNAAGFGGGILNTSGAVFVAGSTVSDDTAEEAGGAVFQGGAWTSQGATYSGNSAPVGGVFFNGTFTGHTRPASFTLTDTGSSYSGSSVSPSTTTRTHGYGAILANIGTASISDATISGTTNAPTDGLFGGDFFNGAQLTLTNVSVSGTTNRCAACGIQGGIIDNVMTAIAKFEDNLDVSGLSVTGTLNSTASSDIGVTGGIIDNADGHATLDGMDVSQTTNSSDDGIYGGVLFSTNWAELSNDAVSGTTDTTTTSTTAEVYGGVLDLTAAATITRVAISGTAVTAGSDPVLGGVFYDDTEASLNDVSVTGTSITTAGPFVFGGALYTGVTITSLSTSTPTTLTAQDVSVTSTTVHDIGTVHGVVVGGGWFTAGALSATDVQVLGTSVTADGGVAGGAFLTAGSDASTITDSTFGGNTVTMSGTGSVYGGIAYFTAGASLVNVTMDDATITAPPASTASVVYVDTAVQLTNDTIANDTVQSTTGAAFTGTEGGLVMGGDYVAGFKNTIVATTPSAANCNLAGKTGASFVSAGGNIDSGTSCGFTQSSDQQSTNPMVATVADNGGPVQTAALLPGSPAIGRGVSAGCPATDARGVARPAGHCDVGAFQTSGQGYWEVASDGGIFTFGTAAFYGSMGSTPLNAPVVGMAATADQGGYWEVASDGGIFSFGDAQFYGSMGGIKLNAPVVGMAATPTGKGYWEVASDGGIFSFGAARFYGSMGGQHLNAPIVGMAAAPTGKGYWEVAKDGGIFTFGAATFSGSMGGTTLNAPVVGMAAAPTGKGYWEVAKDGGIFTFGTATFSGSTGGTTLNAPMVGMAATPDGGGYWEIASDGGVFSMGDAVFQGSMGGKHLNQPVVGGAGFERL